MKHAPNCMYLRRTHGRCTCGADDMNRAMMRTLTAPTPAAQPVGPTDATAATMERAWWIAEMSSGRSVASVIAEGFARHYPAFKGQDPEEVLAGERGLIAALRAQLDAERAARRRVEAALERIAASRPWTGTEHELVGIARLALRPAEGDATKGDGHADDR